MFYTTSCFHFFAMRLIIALIIILLINYTNSQHHPPQAGRAGGAFPPTRYLHRSQQQAQQINNTVSRTPSSLSSSSSGRHSEGALRLVGGESPHEGNLLIYHVGRYGSICDDEWDLYDASVACRQLGYPLGASAATTDSTYGPAKEIIWMDGVNCKGDEASLADCLFAGWHVHDCDKQEAAGVVCKVDPNTVSGLSSPRRQSSATARSRETREDNNELDNEISNQPFRPPLQPARSRDSMRGFTRRLNLTTSTWSGDRNYVNYRIPSAASSISRQPRVQEEARNQIQDGDQNMTPNMMWNNNTINNQLPPLPPALPSRSQISSGHMSATLQLTGRIRLAGGRSHLEGRIEVELTRGSGHRLDDFENNEITPIRTPSRQTFWSTVCPDGWSLLEAGVVCRQLGFGYAASAGSLLAHSSVRHSHSSPTHISGVKCEGSEDSLSRCTVRHITSGTAHCPQATASHPRVAGVVCAHRLADLVPDTRELARSAHIEDQLMANLQCAMEENCLAKSAYDLRTRDPNWLLARRRLLRFTARIVNIGTADFRPFLPKEAWQWHACHRHYHSMEVFAHFDILDMRSGLRMAEGHKASFCLEDNECAVSRGGTQGRRRYSCSNYGDQGISVGCADTYRWNIDCQWIDVTDLPPGYYQLKVTVNPEHKVGEMSFSNNAALCNMQYTSASARVYNCTLTKP